MSKVKKPRLNPLMETIGFTSELANIRRWGVEHQPSGINVEYAWTHETKREADSKGRYFAFQVSVESQLPSPGSKHRQERIKTCCQGFIVEVISKVDVNNRPTYNIKDYVSDSFYMVDRYEVIDGVTYAICYEKDIKTKAQLEQYVSERTHLTKLFDFN